MTATMKLRLTAIAAALAMTTVLPMPASAFTDSEKAEMGAFVRQYLIDNPEVLVEAQQALETKQDLARTKIAQQAVSANTEAIFSSPDDVSIGNPKGDVTVVEFFDYNCGYCRHALADMKDILAKDKNVRFVLKEFPILGQDSVDAHRVSDAFRKIAPEKAGEFHLALLGSEGTATEASALQVASSLGVNETQIRDMMAKSSNEVSVRQTYELAKSLGMTGTPSYVIANEAVFGAIGAASLSEKIANVRACGKAAC